MRMLPPSRNGRQCLIVKERPPNVGADQYVEIIRIGHCQWFEVAQNSGIGEYGIQSTEAFNCLSYSRRDCIVVSNIASNRDCAAACCFDVRLQLVDRIVTASDKGNLCTFVGQPKGSGPPHTRSRTRN